MPFSIRPFRRFPVQCADWTHCGSKAAWIHQVTSQRPDLDWYWIDDDITAQEIEAYQLPAHRCMQVSAHGADALNAVREQLELLHEGVRR